MLNVPLNMIRAFAVVYDTGGIRPAARRLGVTHTSVLRFVRELEAFLAVDLTKAHAGSRHLAFTSAGDALGKAALASLGELEIVVEAIREAHNRKSVVIESAPSVASRWLLPRLAALEAMAPSVEVSLIVDQNLRGPNETGADLAIRLGLGPWPEGECIPLMDDFLLPVMSPAYWQEIGARSSPSVLKQCRLLHDRDPTASWSRWKTAFGPEKLNTRAGPRFPSADLLLTAAEQGLGVALSRKSLAANALATGHLIAPFSEHTLELPKSVWVVLPKIQAKHTAVKTVIDWLQAQAKLT